MYFVCCQILGVEPGADQETIKVAYRKSAKELHPDINDSEKAHEYFVILKNAYEFLINHQYSAAEIRVLKQQEQLKKGVRVKAQGKGKAYYRPSRTRSFTLREVLKESLTARIIYIAFHLLFLFVGVWLVFHSLNDLFFYQKDSRVEFLSAYSTIAFGFLIGLVLTSTFLITGITYLRNRY